MLHEWLTNRRFVSVLLPAEKEAVARLLNKAQAYGVNISLTDVSDLSSNEIAGKLEETGQLAIAGTFIENPSSIQVEEGDDQWLMEKAIKILSFTREIAVLSAPPPETMEYWNVFMLSELPGHTEPFNTGGAHSPQAVLHLLRDRRMLEFGRARVPSVSSFTIAVRSLVELQAILRAWATAISFGDLEGKQGGDVTLRTCWYWYGNWTHALEELTEQGQVQTGTLFPPSIDAHQKQAGGPGIPERVPEYCVKVLKASGIPGVVIRFLTYFATNAVNDYEEELRSKGKLTLLDASALQEMVPVIEDAGALILKHWNRF